MSTQQQQRSDPLQEIEEKHFHSPCYQSRWGVDYCIDAMLEHAVMHPIRHVFQLEELMLKQAKGKKGKEGKENENK